VRPLIFLLLTVLECAAQDTVRDWRVHSELQVISLPEKAAIALLPELRDEGKIEAAWKRIETMLAEGGGTLVAAPMVVANADEKGEAKQGEEVRYGSEYSSAQLIEPEPKPGDTALPGKDKALGISYPATAFEIRHVGITLTAEAGVSKDGQTLDVTVKTEHTWHLGWSEFESGQTLSGEKIQVKQPKFASVKADSVLTMRSGERMLLSFHRVPGEQGRMELFLLRAWTAARPGK
jgi:hypothetical protein